MLPSTRQHFDRRVALNALVVSTAGSEEVGELETERDKHAWSYIIHYPKYDDKVCSKLFCPRNIKYSEVVVRRALGYIFSDNCWKSNDNP